MNEASIRAIPTENEKERLLDIPLSSPTGSNTEFDFAQEKANKLKKLNISLGLHMFIPLYGLIILIAVLV